MYKTTLYITSLLLFFLSANLSRAKLASIIHYYTTALCLFFYYKKNC